MTIGIRLATNDGRPLYMQIFDGIVSMIETGVYPPGHRLPATRKLAQDLGTHRNTVVRAFEELVLAGYLTSAVGRGTFVAERTPHEPTAVAPRGGLPWPSLVSRVADAEPLKRLERLRKAQVGPNTINLTRSQPSADLTPEDLFKRCTDHVIRTRGPSALCYAPREGVGRLRAAVADELNRRGVPVTRDDVVITSGSQQALDVVLRALIDPDDTFIVEAATYAGMLNLLAAARAHVVPVPCDDDGPQLAALERLVRGNAKGIYVIPNAQNPTGQTMSLQRRQALIQWSRQATVPIIEDDYAADLDLTGTPPPPALRALDRDVIHVGTFSKNLIPALRIGYLVCPLELRDTMVSIKSAMDLGTSAFMQHVAAEFLERGYMRSHLARTIPEYRRRRDAMVDALRSSLSPDIAIRVPTRGIAVWLDLPRDLDPERVHDAALREGVLVAPSTLYGPDQHAHGIRMTFCSEPIERLEEGARRLARAIEGVSRDANRAHSGLDVV